MKISSDELPIRAPLERQTLNSVRAWRSLTPDHVLGWIVLIALLVLIGLPLGSVIIQAFVPGLFYGDRTFSGFSNLLQIFERRLWRVSLTNSLQLAIGTAFFGTILGVFLAYIRTHYRFWGAGALDATAWTLLILPSFVISQGWVLFAARGGIAEQVMGNTFVREFIFSPMGLITVMTLKNFPFAYLTMRAALKWNVASYADAARLNGAGFGRVLFTVRLPLLIPAMIAGAVLVFVDTIGDFGLPAALATSFRYPTLTYSIYTAINQAPIRFDLAGVLSFYLIIILMFAVALHFWVVRRSFFDFLTARATERIRVKPRYHLLLSIVVLCLLVLMFGIPLGTSILVSLMDQVGAPLTLESLTTRHYVETLAPGSRLRESLTNSLMIAGFAGLGSIILGLSAAYLLTFSNFSLSKLIDVTCTTTLAVPGVILGVGFIFVWNHPWLVSMGVNVYGHPSILVLAAIAGSVPIAVRLILGSIAQVPRSYLTAAALQGASLPRRLQTILIPLLMSAVLSATLAAFGSSVFDLALTSILRPPHFEVIPVTINRQFQQGFYGLSTAGTVLAGMITVALILSVQFAVMAWVRWRERVRDELNKD